MIDAPVPYVWLAPASDGADAPARASDADDARVRSWTRARGAAVRRPEPSAALAASGAAELLLIDGIEAELAAARDALAALDVAALEAALARAEATLRDHPELPAAAWLRAEVERGWASRFSRAQPRDDARAARAWKRAAALDGGRVAGVGEVALGAAELFPVNLRFAPAPSLEVRIDGNVVAPGVVSLGEGEHAVVATRAGHAVWATWAGVAKGAVLTLPSFAAAPCTEDDFAAVRADSAGVIHAPAVTCARWFVVRGGDSIAQCRGSTCGKFVPFARSGPPALAQTPAPARADTPRTSTWVTLGAVGLGVLITSGSLIAASGVFDKPVHESRWVSGGLRTE